MHSRIGNNIVTTKRTHAYGEQSFYSTQFVARTDYNDRPNRLEYTQNWWLFFAVSVPLTLLTIVVWYVWANAREFQYVLRSLQPRAKMIQEQKQDKLAVVC